MPSGEFAADPTNASAFEQRGLVVADKAERVKHYSENMHKEIGIIAHSCGVAHPRALKRYHVRIVQSDSRSIPLDELYPYPEAARERA